MPIATIQRSMRELGRIRTGTSRPGRGGFKVPTRLETFRLTSSDRSLIEHAAEAFGGDVAPWENQWEVVTETPRLDVVIPPGEVVEQWFELWAGGAIARRCTGVQNVLTMGACECPADPAERNVLAAKGDACKPTTRLRLMLPQLPDIGVWRLESHGYYAAVELAGAAEVLAAATARGILLPARVRLEERRRAVVGKQTKIWMVPVIEFNQTRMADLLDLPPTGVVVRAIGGGGVKLLEPPRADLPASSDFRSPVAEVEIHTTTDAELDAALGAQESAPADGGRDAPRPVVGTSGPPAALSPGGRPDLTELGQTIAEAEARNRTEAWALVPPSDTQRSTLAIVFGQFDHPSAMAVTDINAGVEALWGHSLPLQNAGEAAAIVSQLAGMDPAEFRRKWRAMLEAIRLGGPA